MQGASGVSSSTGGASVGSVSSTPALAPLAQEQDAVASVAETLLSKPESELPKATQPKTDPPQQGWLGWAASRLYSGAAGVAATTGKFVYSKTSDAVSAAVSAAANTETGKAVSAAVSMAAGKVGDAVGFGARLTYGAIQLGGVLASEAVPVILDAVPVIVDAAVSGAGYIASAAIGLAAETAVDSKKLHEDLKKAKSDLNQMMHSTSLSESASLVSPEITEKIKHKLTGAGESAITDAVKAVLGSMTPLLNDIVELNITLAFTRIIQKLQQMEKDDPTALAKIMTDLLGGASEGQEVSDAQTVNKELSDSLSLLVFQWGFPNGKEDLQLPSGVVMALASQVGDVKDYVFKKLEAAATNYFSEVFGSVTEGNYFENKVLKQLTEMMEEELSTEPTTSKGPFVSPTPEQYKFNKAVIKLARRLAEPLLEGLPFPKKILKKMEKGLLKQTPALWAKLTEKSAFTNLFQTFVEKGVQKDIGGKWEDVPPQAIQEKSDDGVEPTKQRRFVKTDTPAAPVQSKSLEELQAIILKRENPAEQKLKAHIKKREALGRTKSGVKTLFLRFAAGIVNWVFNKLSKKYQDKISLPRIFDKAKGYDLQHTLTLLNQTITPRLKKPGTGAHDR